MKKTKLGQELIKGLKESLEFERGKRTLRVSDVKLPKNPPVWSNKQIVHLRKDKLRVSQPVFASYLGVSISALRGWEQGLKNPSSIARRLLQVLSKDPDTFIRLIRDINVPKKKAS